MTACNPQRPTYSLVDVTHMDQVERSRVEGLSADFGERRLESAFISSALLGFRRALKFSHEAAGRLLSVCGKS